VREWRRKGAPDQPMAWLVTVARNLIVTHYRARKITVPEDALAGLPGGADTHRDAVSTEAATAVHHALARMPAAQAGLIETFHFDDRPAADIASQSGISERAVEGRLRRARQRLRRELESILKIAGGTR
jgi:RNA polymerase sigma-70 factor (ECF subfamily)